MNGWGASQGSERDEKEHLSLPATTPTALPIIPWTHLLDSTPASRVLSAPDCGLTRAPGVVGKAKTRPLLLWWLARAKPRPEDASALG